MSAEVDVTVEIAPEDDVTVEIAPEDAYGFVAVIQRVRPEDY